MKMNFDMSIDQQAADVSLNALYGNTELIDFQVTFWLQIRLNTTSDLVLYLRGSECNIVYVFITTIHQSV